MAMKRQGQRVVVLLLAVVGLGAGALETPLVSAVKEGDRQAVRQLLQSADADVNAPAVDGTTALHWAVHRDDLETVDLLLRAGANANAGNRYGVTPLSLAALNGSAAAIDRLLTAGADANTSLDGETVLMTAARTGNVPALKSLIAHGAEVNARDGLRGQTALMWAASLNHAEAVRTLIEAGADLRIRTERATEGQESRGLFGAPPPTSFSALLFAVRGGRIDAVRVLLDAGADVNDTLPDGQSALVVAVANAHWELAGFLLDKGADPNRAGAGWNALHQAVRTRRPNIGFGTPGPIPTGTLDSINVIKKMIERGVDLNARMTKNGIRDGQRNRLNRLGATAFFLAAKNTDVEVMRVLHAAGADANIPSAEQTTPLMVAAGLDIWNPGEDGGSLPGQEPEVLEAVRMCVELGNDVNKTNMYGETALHGVAYRGVNIVAEYLVEQGARLDARDERGWTPLAIANGLSYSDFYKEQRHTAALLRQLMEARGLSTNGHVVDPKICFDCLQTRSDLQREERERDRKMEAEFAASQTASRE